MTSKIRVHAFSISLDGYGAGPGQCLEFPMGQGSGDLHKWFIPTTTFQQVLGDPTATGTLGIDNDFAAKGFEGIGATIMGRNMFGPIRGEWPNEEWQGWWGPNPPYHHPVFVLTNHPRADLEMEGGTTFYFVTGGIHEVHRRAVQAAGDLDIRLGGGVSTVQQFLSAGLVDYMHVALTPTVMLGAGERLLDNIPTLTDTFDAAVTHGDGVVHIEFARR